MKIRHDNAVLPFQLSCHAQLGAGSNDQQASSLTTFGQANIQTVVNLANGNLFVRDKLLSFPDVNTRIDMAYYFNSQSSTPWQLAVGNRLQIDDASNNITLSAADGHALAFQFDQAANVYRATRADHSRLAIERIDDQWVMTDPATGEKEYFNLHGQLCMRVDRDYNTTAFVYDHEDALTQIHAPSGRKYEIVRDANRVEIYCQYDAQRELVHTYALDNNQQLTSSCSADGYATEYTYQQNQLSGITQTDQTTLAFEFIENRCEQIHHGDAAQAYRFDYQPHQTIFTQPTGVTQTYTINNQSQLTIERSACGENEYEETHYTHNTFGQITQITYPDHTTADWTYDASTGLLKEHRTQSGLVTTYHYTDDQPPRLYKKVSGSNAPRTTYYVHDEHGHPRFEISTSGSVKEHRYDARGLLIATYQFPRNQFAITAAFAEKPTLAALESWKNTLDQDASLCIAQYQHDARGLITGKHPTAIDGLQKPYRETMQHDLFGRVIDKKIQHADDLVLQTAIDYNDNGLMRQKTDGANTKRVTTFAYQQNTIEETKPNGATHTREFNATGQLSAERLAADNAVRETQVTQALTSRVKKIQLPDGLMQTEFYHQDGRVAATISPNGAVVTYQYNDKHRYHIKKSYPQVVNLPMDSVSQLEQALSDQTPRVAYTFHAANGLPQYEIDAAGALVETQYNQFNQETQRIQYAAFITEQELAALLHGKFFSRYPDPLIDRMHTTFYDADGYKAAEVDAANYVTRYERDQAHRLTCQSQYTKPLTTRIQALDVLVQAVSSMERLKHEYAYNTANQMAYEIDAAGIKTSYDYYASGKQKSITRTSLDGRTRVTSFDYDDLGRLIKTTKPKHRIEMIQYDAIGHIQSQWVVDAMHPDKTNADHARGMEARFDGFGQLTQQANPFVAQRLADIELANLDAAAKLAAQQALLDQHADKAVWNDSGLKIQSINALGHKTLYFYDRDQRPVCTIDPTGAITHITRNAFGEPLTVRRYYHRLEVTTLQSLTGGFADAALTTLLNAHKDPRDRIIDQSKRDPRGLVEEVLDAEKIPHAFKHNAFGEVEEEQFQLKASGEKIIVRKAYDPRGLETVVTQQAGEKIIQTRKQYDNCFAKPSRVTNALGGTTLLGYDQLGREQTVSEQGEDGRVVQLRHCEWTAFDEIEAETDANQQTTFHKYHDETNTVEVIAPTPNHHETLTHNIFDEVIQRKDLTARSETMTHAPDGQTKTTSVANLTTTNHFDLAGQVESITHPDGVRTELKRDAAGHVIATIEHASASHPADPQITTLAPNAFGDNETTISPDGLVTELTFNRNGVCVLSTRDPQGLREATQLQLNACGVKTGTIQRAASSDLQYETKSELDDFGRKSRDIIDPNNLALTTQYTLDDANNIIAEVNANGYKTLRAFNQHSQKRFEISEMLDALQPEHKHGAAREWTYTQTGKIRSVRKLSQPADLTTLSSQPTVTECRTALRPGPHDPITLYLYDELDRETFQLQLIYQLDKKCYQAIVVEKRYDFAGNVSAQINYPVMIDVKNIDTLTTLDVQHQLPMRPDADTRYDLMCYDEANREILIINQDGLMIEKQYDAGGRLIAEHTYERPMSDPWMLHQLPSHHILDTVRLLNKGKASCKSIIYDGFGREQFLVQPNGLVIKKDYDAAGHVTSLCEFKEPIDPRLAYAELCEVLRKRVPNETVDAMTKTVYDKLGRIQSVTDPLGYQESYAYDALGCEATYTDKNGRVSAKRYDSAKRLIEEISPLTTVSFVKKGEDGKLSVADVKTTITKKTERDAMGNATTVTAAYGLGVITDNAASERQVKLSYNTGGQVTSLSQHKVLVDEMKDGEPTGKAVAVTLDTANIHDARGNLIAQKNEAGGWDYQIYDALGRLTYKVIKDQRVIQYTYNTNNQVTREHRFTVPFAGDVEALRDVTRVNEAFQLLRDHEQKATAGDRITTKKYDRAGRLTTIKKNAMLYYVPSVDPTGQPSFGKAEPEQVIRYDVRGNDYYTATLVKPGVYDEECKLVDEATRCEYHVDRLGHVTFRQLNVQGKVTKQIEYANAVVVQDKAALKIDQLKSLIEQNGNPAKDILKEFEYNQRGELVAERLYDVTTQTGQRDAQGVAAFNDVHHDYIEKRYTYTPTGKIKTITDYDNTVQEIFYDERDNEIARKAVPRMIKQADGSESLQAPLTQQKIDAFGAVIATLTSPDGCAVDTDAAPVFTENATIYANINLNDNRGLPEITQDGDGNQTAYTHTATRLPGATTVQQKAWKKQDGNSVPTTNEDKVVEVHDTFEQLTATKKFRNGQLMDEVTQSYNLLGDKTGSGDGKQQAVENKVDNNGHAWFSNASRGAKTLEFCDLRSQPTLKVQSPTVDLADWDYSVETIEKILAADKSQVECTEMIRDARARMQALRAPIWFKNPNKYPNPTQSFVRDRWDNILSEFDSMMHETSYEHDKRQLLISETKPETTVVLPDNTLTRARPKTEYYHDLGAHEIGLRDGNGHTQMNLLNEAGQVVGHVLGDGLLNESSDLDLLGRSVLLYDARKNAHQFKYNAKNNVAWHKFPMGAEYGYEDDVYGNRISVKGPDGRSFLFNFDMNRCCTQQFYPQGQVFTRGYDHNQQQTLIDYPSGYKTTWERDFFGVAKEHIDINGRVVTYKNNLKNMLELQTSEGGMVRPYLHMVPGNLSRPAKNSSYSAYVENNVPKQHIEHKYGYGLLSDIIDTKLENHIKLIYDTNQQRTDYESINLRTGQTHRKIVTNHDEWRRPRHTSDIQLMINGISDEVEIDQLYDGVSNVRRTQVSLLPPVYMSECHPGKRVVDYWNTFNDADNVLIAAGLIMDGKTVQIAPARGSQFGYDRGFRDTEIMHFRDGRLITSHLDYNADSLLERTSNSLATAAWGYEARRFPNSFRIDAGDFIMHTSEFDENGWIKGTKTYDSVKAKHMSANGYLFSETSINNTPDGYPANSDTTTHLDHLTTYDHLDDHYFGGDGPMITNITGTRSNSAGSNPFNPYWWHDANLNPQCKFDSEDELPVDGVEGRAATYYETTTDGLILTKQQISFPNGLRSAPSDVGPQVYFPYRFNRMIYDVNHKAFGAYTTTVSTQDYMSDIFFHKTGQKLGQCSPPVTTELINYAVVRPAAIVDLQQFERPNDAVNGEYTSQAIHLGQQTYVTMPGDTIESISEKFYGDASYARQIEISCGLLINKTLAPGTLLVLPQVIPSKHTANTARPYNELTNLLIGQLAPHVVTPVPQAKTTSFLGAVLKALAIGLVLALAPMLATFMIPAGAAAFTTGHILATAAVAAVGDAAVQGLSIALTKADIVHIQTEFSVSEMLETAASAAALDGAKALGLGTGGAFDLPDMAKRASYVAATQCATQFAEIQLGLRDKFDPKAILTQVASSLAAPMISEKMQSWIGTSPIAQGVTNATNTVANSYIQSGITHTPVDVESMVAQAIGNTAANHAADKIEQRLHRQTTPQQRTPATHHAAPQHAAQPRHHATSWNHEMAMAEAAVHMEVPDPALPYNLGKKVPQIERMQYQRRRMLNSVKNLAEEAGQFATHFTPLGLAEIELHNLNLIVNGNADQRMQGLHNMAVELETAAIIEGVAVTAPLILGSAAVVGAGMAVAKVAAPIVEKVTPVFAKIASKMGLFGREAVVESVAQKAFQPNRFHQAVKNLPKEAQQNIRTLRGWAKSKGWVRGPNPEGGPEVWGVRENGGISWRLKIKPEIGTRVGLEDGSQIPRFASRLNDQGLYVNPFSGELGGRAIGAHIPLENPLGVNLEESFSNNYTASFRG